MGRWSGSRATLSLGSREKFWCVCALSCFDLGSLSLILFSFSLSGWGLPSFPMQTADGLDTLGYGTGGNIEEPEFEGVGGQQVYPQTAY